jgi:long-chain acyl-CoA synthetase
LGATMNKKNSVYRFYQRVKQSKTAPAHFTKKNGGYQMQTWGEYGDATTLFAKGLMALGHQKGEALAILAFNRPEWLQACVGVQSVAGVSAGIYTSCAASDVKHVVSHSGAPFIIVENENKFNQQIKPVLQDLQQVRHIIMIEDAEKIDDSRVITFQKVKDLGKDISDEELESRKEEITPESTATLIYTSGTTGRAKAVMLSHKAVDFTVDEAVHYLNVTDKDILLSYLPLAHVAEQMFSVYAPIYSGMVLYFAESLDKLPDNLKEAQPTVFFGVPRVYEKFHEKISQRLTGLTGAKKWIFDVFGATAKEYWLRKHGGENVSMALNFKYQLGRKLMFDKVKAALGLSRTRLCVSGAAPISSSILEFFLHLDLPIYEVYGQSEDSGPTSFNVPGQTRLGSVGKAFPGVQVKIAHDGEILVKGPNLFSGYFKDEAATSETMSDGWLLTGDIGELDADGYLKITDRKKDLLITAGGKNVAPQNLEALLKQIPHVSSAVVVGDRRKYLAALLTPNWEFISDYAKKEGISESGVESLVKNGRILEAIQKQIDSLNMKLTPVEQIKKFHLLERDFSIESGELTPTMKVKRKVVSALYEEQINKLYA